MGTEMTDVGNMYRKKVNGGNKEVSITQKGRQDSHSGLQLFHAIQHFQCPPPFGRSGILCLEAFFSRQAEPPEWVPLVRITHTANMKGQNNFDQSSDRVVMHGT